MIKQNETTSEQNIIEITACRFSIDSTYDTNHKIDLRAIWGFELHWRGDDWHVLVVTREHSQDGYRTYELDHWVPISEVRKLFVHSKVMIKKIVNFHSSKNFIQELQKVMQ